MIRSRARFAAIAAVVAVLVGCGMEADPDDGAASPSATAATPTGTPSRSSPVPEPTSAEPGTTITTGSSDFGTMLFDGAGQAAYMWQVEASATPQCYGDCARSWPPVLTAGPPKAAGDVQPGLLGTAPRSDGTTQVTYNGHPLYYYVDEGPGEVRCHNVATHGGLWWVVQPDGNRAP